LKNADLVLALLAKITSSANVLAYNRTINSDHIAADEESPDVYRILDEPPTYVKVVKRGRKDSVEVDRSFLSRAVILIIHRYSAKALSLGPSYLTQTSSQSMVLFSRAKTVLCPWYLHR
jgi:hypothetical protein